MIEPSTAPLIKPADKDFAPPVVPWLAVGYIAVLFAGAVGLRQGSATVGGQELSHVEALFESINALTLSGLATDRPLGSYSALGQGFRAALSAAGLLMGMFITATAVRRITKMRYTDAQILTAVVGYTGLAVLIGAAAMLSPPRTMFQSLLMSLSAFGRAGLSTEGMPGVMDWRVQGVLMPLAALGGLGIPVLMELVDRLSGRLDRLSRHSRAVITMAAGVYLAGTGGLLLVWRLGGTDMAWTALAARASAEAINATGAGLPLIELYRLPPGVLWGVGLLMTIGSAPSGSGSGIRTTVWVVLSRPIRSLRRKRSAEQASPPAVGVALLWLGVFASLTGGTFIGLLLAAPLMPADRALFNALAATTHTGPGVTLGTLPPSALIGLGLAMVLARMIPWLLIWMLVDRSRQADIALP